MKISSCLILAAHISFLPLSEYPFSLFLPLPIWQAGAMAERAQLRTEDLIPWKPSRKGHRPINKSFFLTIPPLQTKSAVRWSEGRHKKITPVSLVCRVCVAYTKSTASNSNKKNTLKPNNRKALNILIYYLYFSFAFYTNHIFKNKKISHSNAYI